MALFISGLPITQYAKKYITAILYLATTDMYHCRIEVAFGEARVNVGTYPL